MAEARWYRALPAALLLGSLAACGQKGPLYLPEQAREVVTRPAQTPPPPDSPAATPNPPPQVPAPEAEKDKKQPDTAPR